MPEIDIPIKILFDVAQEFSRAGRNTAEIQIKLESKMKILETSWSDSTKQQFFRYYHELNQQLGACNQIMDTMAHEMQAIAERYSELEK